MAARSRRPEAADLGHRIREHLHGRAEERPGEFRPLLMMSPARRLDGVLASMIREAVPGISYSDLRRAREYLNASGMVVNMGGDQRGAGPPQWFIAPAASGTGRPRPRGTPPPADLPAVSAPDQPAAGNQPTDPGVQPGQDIAQALQALARQVSQLQADNDRLHQDNDRLHQDNDRLSSEIGAFGPHKGRPGNRPPGHRAAGRQLKTNRCPDGDIASQAGFRAGRGSLPCPPAVSALCRLPSGARTLPVPAIGAGWILAVAWWAQRERVPRHTSSGERG